MSNSKIEVLRVDIATVRIFSLLFAPALVNGLLSIWRPASTRDLWLGVMFCVLYLAALYWMCGRTVELVPGRLVYRVFFVTKVIDVTDLVAAAVVARPAPTLELRRRGSRTAVPVFIVKPFTRAGVAAILEHIRESSPGVRLDGAAGGMGEGRFDSIAHEACKAMNLLRLVFLVVGTLVAAAVARALFP